MNSLRAQHKITRAPARRGWLRICPMALLLASAGLWRAVPSRAQTAMPAPVTIGAKAPAEKPELAPIDVKGKASAPSELAPVVIGASDSLGKSALAPVQVGGVAAIEPTGLAAVNASSLRVPLLLKPVLAGTAKVEDLLRAGALTPDDLKWAVHHPLLWKQTAPVGAATPSTIAVYDAFLARFSEEVAGAVDWEDRARAALAAELSRRGDARCVPLFEAMTEQWVANWQSGDRRKIDGVVPGIHALAWFYDRQDEKLKAAQTYELSALYSSSSVWVSNSLMDAARLYRDLGDNDKAQALYAQVSQYGDSWTTGMALYDQAYLLVASKEHDAARALLQQAIISQNATPARVALLSLLGYSYYATGEVQEARSFSEEAIASYQSLSEVPDNKGLRGALRRSLQILQFTQPKAVNPLAFEPSELHFVIDNNASLKGADEPKTRHMVVRALRPVPLTIISDLPAVTVQMGEHWKPVPNSNWVEKEVEIQVRTNALPEKTRTIQAKLNASSNQAPDFKGEVPVFIELR